MAKLVLNCALLLLATVPFAVAFGPILWIDQRWLQVTYAAFIPMVFASIYVAIAITIARTVEKYIVPGTFPRDLKHEIYGPRRIYGTMWTSIFYFKPLYWFLLSNDFTKRILLRGFGYRGALSLTVYPDTWIRDLPLLDIGEKAYIANKSTMGTNIVLKDGNIMVDRIRVGARSIVGHLCIIGIGTKIGEDTEIGLGSATGILTSVGSNVSVGARCDLNHGSFIGDGTKIGSSSYIGTRVKIKGERIEIPPHSNIPAGSTILSQDDVSDLTVRETVMLKEMLENSMRRLRLIQVEDDAKAIS